MHLISATLKAHQRYSVQEGDATMPPNAKMPGPNCIYMYLPYGNCCRVRLHEIILYRNNLF